MGTRIKRTEKEICIKNLDENTIRRMSALGGLESHCLNMDWDRFRVYDRFTSPVVGEPKPDGIKIAIEGFDTDIRVWNNGQVQGYYNSGSGKAQYAANYLDWVNLMLEQEFYEISND